MVARAARGIEIGINASAGQTTGAQGGGVTPPSFCTVLNLGPGGPPDPNAIVVYAPAPGNATNNFTVENVAGGAAPGFGLDPVNTFSLDGVGPVVAAVSALAPTVLNDGGSAGLIVVDVGFTVFQSIQFDFGTGSNGQFKDLLGTPIGAADKPYPTVWPYELQVEVAEDGTATYSDNNGQSGALPSGGVFTGKILALAALGAAPLTAAGKSDITLLGGSTVMPLPLVNPAAVTWCNLSPVVILPEYKFFETVPPDSIVVLSNADRTLTYINDNVEDGGFFDTVGWFSPIPTSVQNPDGNTVEIEINSNTDSAINGFLVFGLQGASTLRAFLIQQDFTSNRINLSNTDLFTYDVGPGDVFAVQPLDNGASDSDVRFIFVPNGGTPVIFDPFPMDSSSDFVFNFSNIAVPQALGTFQATFNGKEADYSFADYPTGSVDYEGNPMPSKVSPYTRVAIWHDNPFNSRHEVAGMTMVTSGAGKTLTATASTVTLTEGWAVCSSMIDNAGGAIVAVMLKITTADAAGQAPALRLHGVGDNDRGEIELKWAAGAITLTVRDDDFTINNYVIKPASTFSNGDVLALELFTSTLDLTAYYYDGVTVNKAGASPSRITYDGAGGGLAPSKYIISGGVRSLQSGESCVLANQNESADMTAIVEAEFNAATVDVLGVAT